MPEQGHREAHTRPRASSPEGFVGNGILIQARGWPCTRLHGSKVGFKVLFKEGHLHSITWEGGSALRAGWATLNRMQRHESHKISETPDTGNGYKYFLPFMPLPYKIVDSFKPPSICSLVTTES